MLAILLVPVLAGSAMAQDAGARAWVQVEAVPTLTRGEARARAYARDFPDVQGFRLSSGWYAIVLGPFAADDAGNRLRALKSERLVPGDSFIADGGRFQGQFWPVGAAMRQPAEGQTDAAPEAAPDAVPDTAPDTAPETAADAPRAGSGDLPAVVLGSEPADTAEPPDGADADLAGETPADAPQATAPDASDIAGAPASDMGSGPPPVEGPAGTAPPADTPPVTAAAPLKNGPDGGPNGAPDGSTVHAAPPAIAGIPDETPAEARRNEALLGPQDRIDIQRALQFAGLYDAGLDGDFGPGTRSAMAAWQQREGVEATGILTTRQRQALLDGLRNARLSLGLESVDDADAGITLDLPMGLVAKGAVEPPFVRYDGTGGSGVRVLLISQPGDTAALGGLFEILQTLQIVPVDGPRTKTARSFTIDGKNDRIVTHAEAELTAAGNIKGFVLVWPAGDDARRGLALAAMRQSFVTDGDAVLPQTEAPETAAPVDLVSGLKVRRPVRVLSGVYVDAKGAVLTALAPLAGCGRITLDDEIDARLDRQDPGLGLALLRPAQALVPVAHASLGAAVPAAGERIGVSGYAYGGRLDASVLTFGSLAEARGLDGSDRMARLALTATDGDAGGPVLDDSGAVVGLLVPVAAAGQVLPQDTAFAVQAPALRGFLSQAGISPGAPDAAGPLPPDRLNAAARDMTVQVSCWN